MAHLVRQKMAVSSFWATEGLGMKNAMDVGSVDQVLGAGKAVGCQKNPATVVKNCHLTFLPLGTWTTAS
jgi:hypothetical protein